MYMYMYMYIYVCPTIYMYLYIYMTCICIVCAVCVCALASTSVIVDTIPDIQPPTQVTCDIMAYICISIKQPPLYYSHKFMAHRQPL